MKRAWPLEEAIAAAKSAGEILRADFHRPGGPRGAKDKAEADVLAEVAIRERLTAAFPGWGYLGEETGRSPGAPGEPVWLVDPNDGTRDYLQGRRGSAVSIGLLHDRRPVLGVVYAFGYPDDEGDLFAWAHGWGPVCRNGRPVSAPMRSCLEPRDVVLVSSKGDLDPGTNLLCAKPARYRAVPSIAHRLALVAAGEAAAAASLFAPGAWDYAAGHALILGAGGSLVNERGDEVVYAEDGTSRSLRAFAGERAVAVALSQRPWDAVRIHGPAGIGCSRLTPGRTVSDPGLLSRAQGALLGHVAGASLGGLVERLGGEILRDHNGGPRDLEDGGATGLLAGQPTDDSELALALARSALAGGCLAREETLAVFRNWLASDPCAPDPAVDAARAGTPDGASLSNAPLVWAVPQGVLAHGRGADEAAGPARDQARMTHPHPIPGDAAAAIVVAVARAVASGRAEEAFEAALAWARRHAVAPVVRALEQSREGPPECGGSGSGLALVTLQNAFYELLHAGSVEDGVVATVRRGGDTDANAAVTGALLGAIYGRAGIPPGWRSSVLSCRPAPGVAGRPRPMEYWPVDVLELAEGLLVAGR